MNRSCFKRESLNRLARPPPATRKQRCNGCRVSGGKTRDGAQLRLDKRDSPSHLRHRLAQVKRGRGDGEGGREGGGVLIL